MIFDRFRKPRWRHKDAAIRTRAIAADQDPALEAALPAIATEDPAPEARLAALKRLDDPRLWSQALNNDSSETLRQQAQHRLCGFLRETDDTDLAQALLAEHAQAHWLENIDQARLHTVRLAVARQTGKTRHWLMVLEPLSDEQLPQVLPLLENTTLLRDLLQKLPRRHKRIRQSLQERLDAALLAQGDPETVEKHALRLCDAYTELARKTQPEILQSTLEQLDAAWSALPAHALPAELAQRREALRNVVLKILLAHDPEHQAQLREASRREAEELLRKIRLLAENPPQSAEPLEQKLRELTQAWQALPRQDLDAEQRSRWADALERIEQHRLQITPEKEVPAEILQLLEQVQQLGNQPDSVLDSRQLTRMEEQLTRLKSQYGGDAPASTRQALQQISQQLHRQVERLQQWLSKLDDRQGDFLQKLDRLDQALEAGQTRQASELAQDMQPWLQPLQQHGRLKNEHIRRYEKLRQNLQEQRRWLHWANEDHRKALCEELERFASQGAHPDAVKEKLRQTWEQWQAWEKSEHPLPGKQRFAASHATWRRFSKMRKQLEKQTEPYFEKKQALQQQRLEQCLQAMDAMDTLLADIPVTRDDQARALEKQRRELTQWLRRMDDLPPSRRKETARQLRQRLKESRQRLDDCYSEWRAERERLIRKVEQAVTLEDLSEAMEQARAVQAQWKTLPHLPRAQEQKLWKALRKHCDAIFARRDQLRERERAEQEQLRQQAESLLQQLQALDFSAPADVESLRIQEQTLEQIRQQWRALEQPPLELQQRFDQQLKAVLLQQNQARSHVERQAFLQRLQPLAETPARAGTDWPAHWAQAWQQGQGASAETDALKQQVLELEILSEQPSPDEDEAERMRVQVELVQNKHAGHLPDEEQLPEWLLLRWLKSGGPQAETLHTRFLQALRQWLETRP